MRPPLALSILVTVALAAACNGEHHSALHEVLDTPVPLADPTTQLAFPSAPPPFTPGIFPCSQCHDGGAATEDTLPAIPHSAHLDKGLECGDCHEDEADPQPADSEICLECHDDLADGSENLRAYFARVTDDAGEITFPDRWSLRDIAPAHETHLEAGVECAACHGPIGNLPFTKPRSAPLMKRCVSCHTEREVSVECKTCHPGDTKQPHANVLLRHAEEQRGCLDCHDEYDRDQLRLANGDHVSFKSSYRLCGQCHGPKLRDWKLGLHGKRTGEWNGAKEYLLCANCHDPHSPRPGPMQPDPRPARPEEVR